ncbi:MAG: sigma-70 family RNA polymerase sigma factor [Saprospiraceae bacterium]|nr:sigma-70 family RNA polymerase sigma factor [Saprospiraceae bacterium]
MDNFVPSGFSEPALVERLQSGERTAFAELYDRYGRNLYALIFEIVQTETDAENLLQDTFVKIWRNIGRYDASKGRLYTWLTVIARRVALDFVRSNYFLEKRSIQSADTAVSVQSPAPEMERLEHIGLERAVEQLEPNLRQVIDMQYFMGYSQQEVADETGLPLGTVKSRTRAALLRLRAQLSFEQWTT